MLIEINENFEIEDTTKKSHIIRSINKMLSEKDYCKLEKLINERLSNEIFLSVLEHSYLLKEELAKIDKNINIAKGNIAHSDGKKKTCYVDVREHSLKYRNIYEKSLLIHKKLDDYREITARAVSCLSYLRNTSKVEGIPSIQKYYSERIGNFVINDKKPKNDEEWTEYKLGGIGGSDVSKIMKTHPKYATQYYKDLFNIKIGVIEKEYSEPSQAIQRGNNWEEYILCQYADNNPDKNIAICDSRWIGEDELDFMRAQFDGLELDEKGNPISIIEIKTGSLTDEWGDPADSFNAVPANYRMQAIWYAKNADVDKAVIVAVLDDVIYREYHLDMKEPRIIDEWNQMLAQVKDFWENVVKTRAAVRQKGLRNVVAPSQSRKGFPRTLNMKESARKLSAYNGESFETTYVNVKSKFDKIKEIHGKKIEHPIIQDTLTALYAEHDPFQRNTPLIGIDIETNGLSPKQGRIIETGIVVSYPNGKQETVLATLHDIPALSKMTIGAGDSTVHRIDVSDIEGKPSFDELSIQKTILETLKKGVMVAHNSSFERDWLIVNLMGFAELLDNDELIILDTMQICSNLMSASSKNNLETFSEDNGIAYEGAHNAITDTMMMMNALRVFQESLFIHKKVLISKATSDERQKALHLGRVNDAARKHQIQ